MEGRQFRENMILFKPVRNNNLRKPSHFDKRTTFTDISLKCN